jgi:hypothetical protein
VKWLTTFGRFWYDFIVGDDWLLALAVVAAVGLTAIWVRVASAAWVVLPVVIIGMLALSIRRARSAARRVRAESER